MFSPSLLFKCASYQATGPDQGWCELIAILVCPSADLFGDTAITLEPRRVWSNGLLLKLTSFWAIVYSLLDANFDSTSSKPNISGVLWTNPATISFPVIGNKPLAIFFGLSKA